jgi:hypothetical protein
MDANMMNVGWGGQSVVRNSIIERNKDMFSIIHDPEIEGMVKIGCDQTLTYTSEIDLKVGPFHLNKED